MDVWEWADDFRRQALARGDRRRVRLAAQHGDAFALRYDDPGHMCLLMEEGRRLADALGEPWWALFYDFWLVETGLFHLRDLRPLPELASRMVLDLRKPAFEGHPLRFACFVNLAYVWLYVDPHGYAGELGPVLDYLVREAPRGEEALRLYDVRQCHALRMGRPEEARRLAGEALAAADAEPNRYLARHESVNTLSWLCPADFALKDWAALAEDAARGEELARAHGCHYSVALFVTWRALAARLLGDRREGTRLLRLATGRMGRLAKPPENEYFDALCAFREADGDLDAALAVRGEELAVLRDRGRPEDESRCRWERCRLLVRLGRPWDEEREALRQAADGLRQPARYLDRLDELARPSGPGGA
jgi:hypothetical protein